MLVRVVRQGYFGYPPCNQIVARRGDTGHPDEPFRLRSRQDLHWQRGNRRHGPVRTIHGIPRVLATYAHQPWATCGCGVRSARGQIRVRSLAGEAPPVVAVLGDPDLVELQHQEPTVRAYHRRHSETAVMAEPWMLNVWHERPGPTVSRDCEAGWFISTHDGQ